MDAGKRLAAVPRSDVVPHTPMGFAQLARPNVGAKNMNRFESYFSNDNIVAELCKARGKLAEKRHEALFFHNIDRSQPSAEDIGLPASWGDVQLDIFPPRKLWNRYRPK